MVGFTGLELDAGGAGAEGLELGGAGGPEGLEDGTGGAEGFEIVGIGGLEMLMVPIGGRDGLDTVGNGGSEGFEIVGTGGREKLTVGRGNLVNEKDGSGSSSSWGMGLPAAMLFAMVSLGVQ